MDTKLEHKLATWVTATPHFHPWVHKVAQVVPKWCPMAPKVVPRVPKGSQNEAKIVPKWSQN